METDHVFVVQTAVYGDLLSHLKSKNISYMGLTRSMRVNLVFLMFLDQQSLRDNLSSKDLIGAEIGKFIAAGESSLKSS